MKPTIEDDSSNARIAKAWSHNAQMEHASIASFARFTLELLAVGAPPRLLQASQDAGCDEIRHAQHCFRIASRFAGAALGPGRLDVSGVEPARDLESVVAATIREGCVGETLSALLAKVRAEGARDAEIRDALARIAVDEERHADLAWELVAWAIARGGEALRTAASRAFQDALRGPISAFHPVLRGVPRDEIRACGLLDEATAGQVVDRALAEVIAPRASALLRDPPAG